MEELQQTHAPWSSRCCTTKTSDGTTAYIRLNGWIKVVTHNDNRSSTSTSTYSGKRITTLTAVPSHGT
jgi:hypothetical protein